MRWEEVCRPLSAPKADLGILRSCSGSCQPKGARCRPAPLQGHWLAFSVGRCPGSLARPSQGRGSSLIFTKWLWPSRRGGLEYKCPTSEGTNSTWVWTASQHSGGMNRTCPRQTPARLDTQEKWAGPPHVQRRQLRPSVQAHSRCGHPGEALGNALERPAVHHRLLIDAVFTVRETHRRTVCVIYSQPTVVLNTLGICKCSLL